MGRIVVNAIVRDMQRAARTAAKEQTRQIRENERAHKALLRQRALNEKERKRLYAEARLEEAESKTRDVTEYLSACESVLVAGLSRDPKIDFRELLVVPQYPKLDLGSLEITEPKLPRNQFFPQSPNPLFGSISWIRRRHDNAVRRAKGVYAEYLESYANRETERTKRIVQLRQVHESQIQAIRVEAEHQHAKIRDWVHSLKAGKQEAVSDYFEAVTAKSPYPDGFPQRSVAKYLRESKLLVVEYDLPRIDESVPSVKSYKYVKTKDEIVGSSLPDAERRRLYSSLIAQIVLRVLHEVFVSDPASFLETVTINAHVDTIDRATGRRIRPCLVSLRVTVDAFRELNLQNVDPIECLNVLNACVSKSPAELTAVRPIVELNNVRSTICDRVRRDIYTRPTSQSDGIVSW